MNTALHAMGNTKHIYEIRPSEYHRTFDLISTVLPRGRAAGFLDADAALSYAKLYSDSHAAVIRVYDDAGNLIETYEYDGDFREW
jgi:hypothetical protein